MMQPSGTGPLALSHRRIGNRGSWALPSQVEFKNAGLLPETTNGHRMLGTADLMDLPVKPAELAQARLFDALLRAELVRLNEQASRRTVPLEWLKHPDSSGDQAPKDRIQVYARLEEVRHLIEALRNRFADARFDGEADK